jgi:pyruvate/2-oxoglutarate/acetoin dehydrogenase E1 component
VRKLTYAQAIHEALDQLLAADERVFLMGQGIDSPWSFGTSTLGLMGKYGPERCFDPPTSENGTTGICIGAAMSGMRPIIMHPRMDFMYLAMDQIFNHAAPWRYMFGGKVEVPIVIRGCINRGNEQAAQHSQSPYAMYTHVPGLSVVMPASASDAKGLLVAAVRDPNPVIYVDDRWLYNEEGFVEESLYETPIGKGAVLVEGDDITVVPLGYLAPQAVKAAETLALEGISVELIDPRSIKPLDSELISKSVCKTGRLVVADPAWPTAGVASEICFQVVSQVFGALKAPPVRVTQPDIPIPASTSLETAFYRSEEHIVQAVEMLMARTG